MVVHDSNDDGTKSFVALTAGTEVSHYNIIEKVGIGGRGGVNLPEDIKLNHKVTPNFLKDWG